jgi:hypothetical protein
MAVFLPMYAVIGLVTGISEMGPAVRAAEGHGRPGTLHVTSRQCGRACVLRGDFVSDDGSVVRWNVEYFGAAPRGTVVGDQVGAIDTGGDEVFQRSGSRHWVIDVLFVLTGLLAGGSWCLRYLARPIMRRQRRRRRRSAARRPGPTSASGE